jgi:hypothetical protein
MSRTADSAAGRRSEGAPAPSSPAAEVQCPSARPEMEGAHLLGMVEGSAERPRLAYLRRPEPVREELLALAGGDSPTRRFRFAAPCAGDACQHFDGSSCRLAARIVERLPEAVAALPVCALRPACRWWRQEGEAACRRCPMVVTESYGEIAGSDELAAAADPATPVG